MITSGLVKQIGPYNNGYPSTYYDSNVQSIRPFMLYQDKPGILEPSPYALHSVVDRNVPFQNLYRKKKKLDQAVKNSQTILVGNLFNGALTINPSSQGNGSTGVGSPVNPSTGGNGTGPVNPGLDTTLPSPSTSDGSFTTADAATVSLTPSSDPTSDLSGSTDGSFRTAQGYTSRRPPGLTINTNLQPSPEVLINIQQQHDVLVERIANSAQQGIYPRVPQAWLDELASLNSALLQAAATPLTSITSVSSEYGNDYIRPPPTPVLPSYMVGTPPVYSPPTLSAAQRMGYEEALQRYEEELNINYNRPIISPSHSEPSGRMPAMTQIPSQGILSERIIFSQLNNMNRPESARSRDSNTPRRPPSDVSMGQPSRSPSDVSMGSPSHGSSGPSRHGSDGGSYVPSLNTLSPSNPRHPRQTRRNTRR